VFCAWQFGDRFAATFHPGSGVSDRDLARPAAVAPPAPVRAVQPVPPLIPVIPPGGGPPEIPEPGTLLLVSPALGIYALLRRARRRG